MRWGEFETNIQLMSSRITVDSLEDDLRKLGLRSGDVVLVRATLGAVGPVDRRALLQALLNVVGEEGTIVGPAFTGATYFWKLSNLPPFTANTPSYAGALPNAMLRYPGAFRSTHPTCSFVAIGKQAEFLTSDHGPEAGAYDPVRKIISLDGKVMLVGCVDSSPGFTTTHVAEVDLGMSKRLIAPWLRKTRYMKHDQTVAVFTRRDPGFCSKSFWKFYAFYVRQGLLSTGFIGNAYSVLAGAKDCYRIDREVLSKDPKFNICGSLDCVECNFFRWDRLHMWPVFAFRRATGLHRSGKKA